MAKVFSHTVFKGSGSVGATYYRKSRGRSILCQKPGERSAEFKGFKSEEVCVLACISMFGAMHATSIKNSFNRTKYGSYRNYFTKVNHYALKQAFLVELVPQMMLENAMPTPEQVEMAIENWAVAHPNTIYRIKKAGYPIVMLEDGWDDADDPVAAPVVATMAPNLDSDYNLTQVILTGENLSGSIQFLLKDPAGTTSVPVAGQYIINSAQTQMQFVPTGTCHITGEKILQARYGQNILKEETLEGDDRVYYNIEASADPANGGTVSGAGSYLENSEITLMASAKPNFSFLGWYKNDTQVGTNPSLTITVTEDAEYVAKFQSESSEVSFSLSKEVSGEAPITAGQMVVKIDGNEIAQGATTGAGVLPKGDHVISIGAVSAGDGDTVSIEIGGEEKASASATAGVSYTVNAQADLTIVCYYSGGF